MKACIISVLFLFAFQSYGQVTDSLLFQLKQIPDDTERVNQIYKAGFEMRNSQPELSALYANECQIEAKKANSPKHLAKSYSLSGILYYKKGEYTKALHYHKMALALNQYAHYDYGVAINQTNLANIYSEVGYYELAEHAYLSALKSYNAIGDHKQMAKCLINLGVLKYSLKQYDAAIKQFNEALRMAEELNDIELKATCNNNIGGILLTQNKPDSALPYIEEGLKLLDITGNEIDMADGYINLGTLYLKKINIKEANHYLALADSICRKYDYAEGRIELYQAYSLLYESQQNYKEANVWLKKHYHLKDSLLQIDKAMPAIRLEEEASVLPAKEEKPVFKNEWILVFLGLLLIGIPIFLMRYKR